MSLEDNPFDWQLTKAGKLIIFRGGRQVMIVSEKKTKAIIAKLGINPESDQHILARVTGQYRYGNERTAKSEFR